MNEKEKIVKLLKECNIFPELIQKKIGRDLSIVYSVNYLEENNIEATFQRICVIAYKSFPESFSLPEFPEFLDSRTVGRCLWHCVDKSKGWLIGSDKTHYNISEKGKKEIRDLVNSFRKGINIENLPISLRLSKDKETKPRDREINFLKEIKSSEAYTQFIQKKIEQIKLIHIKKSLGGDRYSSPSYLQDNLEKAIRDSKSLNERDILEYLLWIKNNWRRYFK